MAQNWFSLLSCSSLLLKQPMVSLVDLWIKGRKDADERYKKEFREAKLSVPKPLNGKRKNTSVSRFLTEPKRGKVGYREVFGDWLSSITPKRIFKPTAEHTTRQAKGELCGQEFFLHHMHARLKVLHRCADIITNMLNHLRKRDIKSLKKDDWMGNMIIIPCLACQPNPVHLTLLLPPPSFFITFSGS